MCINLMLKSIHISPLFSFVLLKIVYMVKGFEEMTDLVFERSLLFSKVSALEHIDWSLFSIGNIQPVCYSIKYRLVPSTKQFLIFDRDNQQMPNNKPTVHISEACQKRSCDRVRHAKKERYVTKKK